MILKLCNTVDAENVLGKNIVVLATININLKNSVDINNPNIILVVDGFNPDDINYCELDIVNKKYFVRSIERVNNRMISLNCECDVLETYKVDILNSNSRYKRNIKTGDYLNAMMDFSTLKTVTKNVSSKGLEGEATMILTTMAD